MIIKIIDQNFSICQVKNVAQIDFSDKFCFIGKTDEELSLVCSTKCVPQDIVKCDPGWKGFRIQGILDFSLVGILSKISTLLAENKIGIYAVSTYNTDYIFIKADYLYTAIKILEENEYTVEK